MTFHFIRPWFFLLIPIVVGTWLLWRKSKDPLRGWKTAMDPELLSEFAVGNRNPQSRPILLGVWLLAIFICAGPTWKPEPSPFSDDPAPVMILLKTDESMKAQDFMPNRMERARLKAIDFAEIRNGRPTGLIAYAGSAHLVLPPTRDTDVVANMVEHVSPEIMPDPGNALNAAIQLAEKHMEGGSLVVIADTIPEYKSNRPVQVLSVSRNKIKKAIQITADPSDVEMLNRRTSGSMFAVTEEGKTRWNEAGYALVPILGIFALLKFRREVS